MDDQRPAQKVPAAVERFQKQLEMDRSRLGSDQGNSMGFTKH